MAKSNAKVLNLSELKKADAKEYGQQKKIIVNDYEIVIQLKFRNTKIQDMFMEMLNKQEFADKEKLDFNLTLMTAYYIVKYFTSFGESIPKNSSLEDDVKIMNMLIDLNFLRPIVEVFNTDCASEMDKINKLVKEFEKDVNKFIEDFKKKQELIKANEQDNKDNGEDNGVDATNTEPKEEVEVKSEK